MKTAIVHDWLTGFGGGEKVLEAIYKIYPSPIFTLVKDKDNLLGTFFDNKEINSSFIQSLPFSKQLYRNYLPFFPLAIEQHDVSKYDLILSSSHAVAKGVLSTANQLHICYCHTPMRYAWDLYHFHINQLKGPKKFLAQWILHYLRDWDYISAQRVDHFIANSKYVSKRIKKIYGRDSKVIYPPVNTESFYISDKKDEYYICYSRFVPYKKMEMIAEAFSYMPEKNLLMIGDGPELKNVKAKASKNIHILGHVKDQQMKELLAKAKALVFAAEEDFGIVMAESLSAGVPVIAFAKGASCEIIENNKLGLLYPEQTPGSLIEAVDSFEKIQDSFDPHYIKKSAERFSEKMFEKEFKSFVEEKMIEFKSK